jgi:hypothetical protein
MALGDTYQAQQNIPFLEDLINKFHLGNTMAGGGQVNSDQMPAMMGGAPALGSDSASAGGSFVSSPQEIANNQAAFGLPALGGTAAPPATALPDLGGTTPPWLRQTATPQDTSADSTPTTLPDLAPRPLIPEDQNVVQPGAPPGTTTPIDITPPAYQQMASILNPATAAAEQGATPPWLRPTATPGATIDTTATTLPALPPAATEPVTPPAATAPAATDALGLRRMKDYTKGLYGKADDPNDTKEFSSAQAARDAGYPVEQRPPGADVNQRWSTWQKIGSALAGWAGGGLPGAIAAGTNRNYFSQLGEQRDLARVLPQIEARQKIESEAALAAYNRARPGIETETIRQKAEADQQRFDQESQRINQEGQRIKNEKDKFETETDANGLRWRVFKNDPNRPTGSRVADIDPTTGKQAIDPSKRLYDYPDPNNPGQTLKLTGEQVANFGKAAQQQEFERQKLNITEQNRMARANVRNTTAYNDKALKIAQNIAQQSGQAAGSLTKATDFKQRVTDLLSDLSKMKEEDDRVGYREQISKINDAQKTYLEEMSKTVAGQQAIQQLKALKLEPPQELKAMTLPAPAPRAGPIPKSKDRLRIL